MDSLLKSCGKGVDSLRIIPYWKRDKMFFRVALTGNQQVIHRFSTSGTPAKTKDKETFQQFSNVLYSTTKWKLCTNKMINRLLLAEGEIMNCEFLIVGSSFTYMLDDLCEGKMHLCSSGYHPENLVNKIKDRLKSSPLYLRRGDRRIAVVTKVIPLGSGGAHCGARYTELELHFTTRRSDELMKYCVEFKPIIIKGA